MIFPEKTLHGIANFKAWYAGGTYSDGSKAPGVINIFFDENHNVVSVKAKISGDQAQLDVVVAWQASWFEPPAAKSKRVSLDAIQRWTVRKSEKNAFGLEIVSYNAMAEPFIHARLRPVVGNEVGEAASADACGLRPYPRKHGEVTSLWIRIP